MDLGRPGLSYSHFRQSLKIFLDSGKERRVNLFNCTLEMLLIAYLFTYLLTFSNLSFPVSR